MTQQIVLTDGVGAQVRDIIASFFSIDPDTVTGTTTSDDISGWDSTTHVGLILTLEEELGIEFSVDQVADFDNVGELIEACIQLVTEKG